MTDSKEEVKFEDALKLLETITDEIERGEIGLEHSIERYERGMKLVTRCREILSTAEQRIQKLTPTLDGKLQASDTDLNDSA